MSIPAYSKKVFIQRIKRHLTNSHIVSDQFPISDNEILLMIDQAAASRMIGQTYNNAKIEGAFAVPDAYYTTFALPKLVQDPANNYWYAVLPTPPMALPLGYSINRVYPKSAAIGPMKDAAPIKAKRQGRMTSGYQRPGTRYWIDSGSVWLVAYDGRPLDDLNWFIMMMTARTTDINAQMNMPEDDVEFVFMDVIKILTSRFQIPQDIVLDGLPAGNKTS